MRILFLDSSYLLAAQNLPKIGTILMFIVLTTILIAILVTIDYFLYLLNRNSLENFAKRESLEFRRGVFSIIGRYDAHLLKGSYRSRKIATVHSVSFLSDAYRVFSSRIKVIGLFRTNAHVRFEKRSIWNLHHKRYKTGDPAFDRVVVVKSKPKAFAKTMLENDSTRKTIKSLISPRLGSGGELVITRAGNLRFHGEAFGSSKLKRRLDLMNDIAEAIETCMRKKIDASS